MNASKGLGSKSAWLGSAARKVIAAGLLSTLFFFAPKPARAGSLSPDVIALFPKEGGEFAYADLKKARTLKWFPQLQEQLLPARFKQFEKFLASAGVDPNSQVEELAWGLVAEGASGISWSEVWAKPDLGTKISTRSMIAEATIRFRRFNSRISLLAQYTGVAFSPVNSITDALI